MERAHRKLRVIDAGAALKKRLMPMRFATSEHEEERLSIQSKLPFSPYTEPRNNKAHRIGVG